VNGGHVLSNQNVLIAIRSLSNSIGGNVTMKFPVLIDEARGQQFGYRVDETRATDPDGGYPPDRQHHGFEGARMDAYLFDGPPSGPHPKLDPCPSNAGPAEQETLANQSLFPKTISPLVPMSIYMVRVSLWNIPSPKLRQRCLHPHSSPPWGRHTHGHAHQYGYRGEPL